MPFEYRVFEQVQPSHQKYGEIDLYFYKPNAKSVGVKARFGSELEHADHWHFTKIELKFIKLTVNSEGGVLEKWRKMASSTDFVLYTPKYIEKNPQKFKLGPQRGVQQVVKETLEAACKAIITALKPNPRLEPEHFKMNQQLSDWFSRADNLQDVLMVKKNRAREDGAQKGGVCVQSIYGPQKMPAHYRTVCVEHDEENKTSKLAQQHHLSKQQNTSYPATLDMYKKEHKLA